MTFHKYPISAIILVLGMIMGILYTLLPTLEYARVIEEQKRIELRKIANIKETKERREKNKYKI